MVKGKADDAKIKLEKKLSKAKKDFASKRKVECEKALDELQEAKIDFQEAKNQAMEILTTSLVDSARELVRLQSFVPTKKLDSQSARIRLEAVKHNLKVNGLEIDRIKLGGDSESPIVVIDAGRDPYKQNEQHR